MAPVPSRRRSADTTLGSHIRILLGDFCLTLPPAMEPLDASRREDHLRWRREALAAARRELARAKRLHWLRRVLTLWIWWR